MSDSHDDESSISSVSTFDGAYLDESVCVDEVSEVPLVTKVIEMDSHNFTNVGVRTNTSDHTSIFTVENWIRLGQAVGRNTHITAFQIYAADSNFYDPYYGSYFRDPIRSTKVQDAFCAALARNRSIQVFHTEGLEYSPGQIRIMRPFFSQSAQLTEIRFRGSKMDPGTIDELTEAIKERGGNVKTIRLFEYSSLAWAGSNQIWAIMELAKECTHLTTLNLSHISAAV